MKTIDFQNFNLLIISDKQKKSITKTELVIDSKF